MVLDAWVDLCIGYSESNVASRLCTAVTCGFVPSPSMSAAHVFCMRRGAAKALNGAISSSHAKARSLSYLAPRIDLPLKKLLKSKS